MAAEPTTPEERIGAFLEAVDEELIRPTRRYLRGFRRGLVMGCLLGLLFTPWPGAESRRRVQQVLGTVNRCRLRATSEARRRRPQP